MSEPTPTPAPPTPGDSLIRWEGGTTPVSRLVRADGNGTEYDLVLWVESGSERVVAVRFARNAPLAEEVAALLRESLERTGAGGRPAELRVTDAELAERLRAEASQLGIAVRVVPECRSWNEVVREFGAFLAARWPGRSYLVGRGVTPECVEGFFGASAAYYRAAPWRVLDEKPIELRLAERPDPLYAVVLGHEHAVHGLTLYLSGASLRQRGAGDHPMRTRGTVAMTFDREDGIPPPMLEERRAHRWPLAGPAAFPLPYRQLTDGTMRDPDAEELSLLTAVLRAVSEFAARHTTLPADGRRIVEAVQLRGIPGDSIARLTFPAEIAEGEAE